MEKLKRGPSNVSAEHPPPPKRVKIRGLRYLGGNQTVDANQNDLNVGEPCDLDIIQKVTSDLATVQSDFMDIADKRTTTEDDNEIEDSMFYWQVNGTKFKSVLPRYALDLLASPCSSVPCERMFSCAGILSAGENYISNFFDFCNESLF